MFDEAPDIQQITENLINQEVPAQEPEVQEEQEQVVQEAPAPSPSLNELNIRELRLAKQRAEKERDEARQLLQSMQQNQQTAPQEELDFELEPDQLAEGKHLSKMSRKMKILEQQIKQYEQRASESAAEVRIKSLYPDFDRVVCKENIDILREQYPEIAQSISSNKDVYSQAVAAYKVLTTIGIAQQDTNALDRAKVQVNASKPKPVASLSPQQGSSALTRANEFANGLTPELQKKLYEEMKRAAMSA